MSERDDYLWQRDGEVDATVQQLERLLEVLAHDGRELPLDALPAQRRPSPWRRRGPWFALAAAAAAVLVWAFVARDRGLQPGADARTFVATAAPLVVPLGAVGDITLQPGSELRFEHWQTEQVLFRLERGTMLARVAPPPAVQPDFFLVDTALGRVTDKGCRYELRVGDDGTNHIHVTEGWVTFAFAQRTVYVPAGAITEVTAKGGPRTPVFLDATIDLQKAVRMFDELAAAGSADVRRKAAAMVEQACREPRDSLVLFHLLLDDAPEIREQAEAALVDLVGPPLPGPSKESHWDIETWLAFLRLGPWQQAK